VDGQRTDKQTNQLLHSTKQSKPRPVRDVYEEVYASIIRYQQNIDADYPPDAHGKLSEEEREMIERVGFALKVSQDVLVNMVTPGKTFTIDYPQGTLTIGTPHKKRHSPFNE
jgi:hypothetical protein